jgi:hypothetical protein
MNLPPFFYQYLLVLCDQQQRVARVLRDIPMTSRIEGGVRRLFSLMTIKPLL